ncbi:flippase [Bacillus timonensis]|nr:flippase [Bacillus timonensis]
MSKLSRNLMYVFIQQFILIGLPFLTIPYISRVLGPKGVGLYSYSFSIITLLVTVFLLGSNLYAAREIAKVSGQQKSLSTAFSEIVYIRIVLLLLASITYAVACMTIFRGEIVFYLQALHLLGAFFDITWFYQGLEQFKKVVLRNILVKLLGFGSVFIFVHKPEDIWVYTMIMGLSVVLGNLLLFVQLGKYVSFTSISTFTSLKKHSVQMLILFIPSFSALIYSVSDKTMLGILSTVQQVGFYEQSYKIVFMITSLLNVSGIVMLPRTSALIAEKRMDKLYEILHQGIKLTLMIVVPLTFGFLMIASDFVRWFLGPLFEPSVLICMVMAPVIIFKALGVILGSWYLVPMEKNKEYTIPIVVGAVLNIILNLALIPFYGTLGAAISTVFTEGIILAFQFWFLRHVLQVKELFKSIFLKYVSTSLLMMGCIYGLSLVVDTSLFLQIVIKVLVGVIVYLGILFVLKDRQLFMMKSFIQPKSSAIKEGR